MLYIKTALTLPKVTNNTCHRQTMATKPRLAYLPAIFVLLLVVFTSVTAQSPGPESSSLHDTFLQCLTKYTKNSSSQLSNIVFANTNPKFPTVLQNYIRNARFNTSSTPKPSLIVTPQKESHVQATFFSPFTFTFFPDSVINFSHHCTSLNHCNLVFYVYLDFAKVKHVEDDKRMFL